MSMYTTGEIARLCGVSVRTVQYYDSRNILIPSRLSEGGRRLYSEDDLRRMKLTCPCCGRKGFCVETYGGMCQEEGKI